MCERLRKDTRNARRWEGGGAGDWFHLAPAQVRLPRNGGHKAKPITQAKVPRILQVFHQMNPIIVVCQQHQNLGAVLHGMANEVSPAINVQTLKRSLSD